MTGRRRTLVVLTALTMAAPAAHAGTGDITLRGHLQLTGITRITNVGSYYDNASGIEYALVGDWFGGFWVIDASDPADPRVLSKVTGAPGYDLKAWDKYVYSCDGNATGSDTRITSIANPAAPVVLPALLPSCHGIAISAQGVLYMGYPGVRIYGLGADPVNPDSLHYIPGGGNDSTPRGNRLYDFNGGELKIWDVGDPSLPVLLGGDDDPTITYYSGGDESPDHGVLYVCDEYAITPGADIVLLDVSNPAAPARIGDIHDASSRVRRLNVAGDFLFVGYATAGFKVFAISSPASPVLADEFDTSPYQTETGAEALDGACNAHPYTRSGHVFVADHPGGLFIFAVEGYTGVAAGVDGGPRNARLGQNYPNPFNPATTIEYETMSYARVVIRVYDVSGARVRTLVDAGLPAGTHRTAWDGRDDAGRAVASGVYYCRLEAGGTREARRMVLLK